MNDNSAITEILEPQGPFKWTPDPELTALSRRYRMIEKTELIGKGVPADLADMLLDKRDAFLSEVFEREVMQKGSEPEGSVGGLLALMGDTDGRP